MTTRDHQFDSQLLVDSIAELYWPSDPDVGSAEARGLRDYFDQADSLQRPSQPELVRLAESLPHTRGRRSIR